MLKYVIIKRCFCFILIVLRSGSQIPHPRRIRGIVSSQGFSRLAHLIGLMEMAQGIHPRSLDRISGAVTVLEKVLEHGRAGLDSA